MLHEKNSAEIPSVNKNFYVNKSTSGECSLKQERDFKIYSILA